MLWRVVGILNAVIGKIANDRVSEIERRLQDFSLGGRVIRTLGGGSSCRDKPPTDQMKSESIAIQERDDAR